MGRDRRQRRRRAAAVAGIGIAAKKHHDSKEAAAQEAAQGAQQPMDAEPDPAAPPSTAGGLTSDGMERLKELGELHEQDVLTDEEFEREKAKLLGTG